LAEKYRYESPQFGEVPFRIIRIIDLFVRGVIDMEEFERRMLRTRWVRRVARETGLPRLTVIYKLLDEWERGLIKVTPVVPPPPVVKWVQFLATMLIRCDSPPDQPHRWRHIEARGIFECWERDLYEARDAAAAVLNEYLRSLDYDFLVDCADAWDAITWGFEVIDEFRDIRDRTFTVYLEVWDMDYERLAYQHIVDGVDASWVVNTDVITDKIEEKRAIQYYHREGRIRENIEERKGVDKDLAKKVAESIQKQYEAAGIPPKYLDMTKERIHWGV